MGSDDPALEPLRYPRNRIQSTHREGLEGDRASDCKNWAAGRLCEGWCRGQDRRRDRRQGLQPDRGRVERHPGSLETMSKDDGVIDLLEIEPLAKRDAAGLRERAEREGIAKVDGRFRRRKNRTDPMSFRFSPQTRQLIQRLADARERLLCRDRRASPRASG